MKTPISILVTLSLLLICLKGFSQAPVISYPGGSQTLNVGQVLKPITPQNTGGAVPSTSIFGVVTTFAGSGADNTQNNIGTKASFSYPRSGIIDQNGTLYIADQGSYTIRSITAQAVVSGVYGHPGLSGYLGDTTTMVYFLGPVGVAFDTDHYLVVADNGTHQLRKIPRGGNVVPISGSGVKGMLDGTATTAKFTRLAAIAADHNGNFLVIDSNAIRKVKPDGSVVTFAGGATPGKQDGLGTAASFNNPQGIAVDSKGNAFVADFQNNLIRKITPDGQVSTYAGTGAIGETDGTKDQATFGYPQGIGIDKLDNIYVCDFRVIRRISPDGTVTTIAGATNVKELWTDGLGRQASFQQPTGAIPDNNGNLYIVDQQNRRIRKIALTGYTISPQLPDGLVFDSTTGIISGTPQTAFAAANYTITAYNADGQSTTVISLGASIPQTTPVISSFWPASASSGQVIGVNGTNMAAVNSVSIGGVAAEFHVISPTLVNVVVGTSSGQITLGSPYGSASASGFKILTAPNISFKGPQTFVTGVANQSVPVVNSGGDVPAELYHNLTNYAPTDYIPTAGFSDGTNFLGKFYGANGIVFDSQGNIILADKWNNRVRKITRSGTISTIAGNGIASDIDGTGTTSGTFYPASVVIDRQGRLIFSELSATIFRQIGPGGLLSSYQVGAPPSTSLAIPYCLTPATDGSLLLSDQGARIVKISASGQSTVLTDNKGTVLQFNSITAIVTDNAGNLYAYDGEAVKLIKISPTGVVSVLAGSGTSGVSDGDGTKASFAAAYALTIDRKGNLYTIDRSGIRMISPTGTVTTILKNTAVNGYAPFDAVKGVAIDIMGDLYSSDEEKDQVKKFALMGYDISPALPAGLKFDPATATIQGTPTTVSAPVTYTITAYNNAGSSSTSMVLDIKNTPVITSFTPTSAGPRDTVTITGANFTGATALTFGNTPAKYYKVISATAIKAIPGSGTSGDVVVTTPAGTGTLAGFTYLLPPAINGFLPKSAKKGDTVLITGTYLTGTTAVTFGGTAAQSFTVVSANQVRAVVGDGTSGIVSLTTGQGSSYYAGFVYYPKPAITSFTPTKGGPNSKVIITGSGFSGATSVSFGGVPALSFTVDSAAQITAVVGNGNSGGILVTTPGGTTTAQSFTFVPAPTILSFTPTVTGEAHLVIIQGTHFTGTTAVSFGGVPAAYFHVDSDTQLTTVTSNGASGSVTVTTPGGVAIKDGFKFVLSPSIISVTPDTAGAGDKVVIKGLHFSDVTSMNFGLTPAASYTIDSDNQITAIVGTGSSGKLEIINAAGNSTYGFTFGYPPVITGISPTVGGEQSVVTITGKNLNYTTFVYIGGFETASFKINSPTSITAVVGPFVLSGPVSVTTTYGSASYGNFTFVGKPMVGLSGPSNIPFGSSVTLEVVAPQPGVTYTWYNGTKLLTSSSTQTYYTTQESGSYFVTATVGNYVVASDPVIINSYFTLPDDNFKVEAIDVSCKGQHNGSISITAAMPLSYQLTLTGDTVKNTPHPFSNQIAISNLAPATYNACITVVGHPEYQQCFTLTISQPKDLSVYTAVSKNGDMLNLQLAGGNAYTIQLNGQTFTTTNSSISVPLPAGSSRLMVSTDKLCQGMVERVINNTTNHRPYPNPFQNILYVNLGQDIVGSADIKIYNIADGRQVMEKHFTDQSGVVQLDVTALNDGVYSFHLKLDKSESVFKIIKK